MTLVEIYTNTAHFLQTGGLLQFFMPSRGQNMILNGSCLFLPNAFMYISPLHAYFVIARDCSYAGSHSLLPIGQKIVDDLWPKFNGHF